MITNVLSEPGQPYPHIETDKRKSQTDQVNSMFLVPACCGFYQSHPPIHEDRVKLELMVKVVGGDLSVCFLLASSYPLSSDMAAP
jgi:hypothetical protein